MVWRKASKGWRNTKFKVHNRWVLRSGVMDGLLWFGVVLQPKGWSHCTCRPLHPLWEVAAVGWVVSQALLKQRLSLHCWADLLLVQALSKARARKSWKGEERTVPFSCASVAGLPGKTAVVWWKGWQEGRARAGVHCYWVVVKWVFVCLYMCIFRLFFCYSISNITIKCWFADVW